MQWAAIASASPKMDGSAQPLAGPGVAAIWGNTESVVGRDGARPRTSRHRRAGRPQSSRKCCCIPARPAKRRGNGFRSSSHWRSSCVRSSRFPGDFVLHPDEIMQYLEPAHRLVFGNGVTYWEYFYGARSWLVPGLVAGVLWLLDAAGLGQPVWYVGAVKLVFCALSLLIRPGCTSSHARTSARPRRGSRSLPAPFGTSWSDSPTSR